MCYHEWGDEWFQTYGEELNHAMCWIETCFKRWTGGIVVMKEKYGTIRYEYLFHTLFQRIYLKGKIQQVIQRYIGSIWYRYASFIFRKLVIKAAIKFENVSMEILDDYICMKLYNPRYRI